MISIRYHIVGALITCALAFGISAASAHAHSLTCPIPTDAPFTARPVACHILAPGSVAHIGSAASEIDIWSAGSGRKARLAQTLVSGTYPKCAQWGFQRGTRYSAGWDSCNGDVYVYGKRWVIVYVWEG
jgi:hypothetical protein